MDLFCSGCRTEFKTQRALSSHLNKSSYCGNKKRKYSSSRKTCKSSDTQKESKSTERFCNNQSNISTDDYCSMNDTSFDDTPIVEKISKNQNQPETNNIDDNSLSNQDETPTSNNDENKMPDIHDPNNFFDDDWFDLLPNDDILNQ